MSSIMGLGPSSLFNCTANTKLVLLVTTNISSITNTTSSNDNDTEYWSNIFYQQDSESTANSTSSVPLIRRWRTQFYPEAYLSFDRPMAITNLTTAPGYGFTVVHSLIQSKSNPEGFLNLVAPTGDLLSGFDLDPWSDNCYNRCKEHWTQGTRGSCTQ
jgi:hypothetical protein